MAERWCTVTVTDAQGKRHSVDVMASSTFDAAHLFVVQAKQQLPVPTPTTVFEVLIKDEGRVYQVRGAALQRWIRERRKNWNGPRGYLFRQRPTLE